MYNRAPARRSWKVLIFLTLASGIINLHAQAVEQRKTKRSLEREPNEVEDYWERPSFYRFRLNTGLGLHLIGESALLIDAQFGYAFLGPIPVYLGPEFNFSLFPQGSLLGIWGSGWYERKIYRSPRLSVLVGVTAGPGFSSHVSELTTTTYAVLADLGVLEELDDLASLRARFRPGIEGNRFAFMMSFDVSFRFL